MPAQPALFTVFLLVLALPGATGAPLPGGSPAGATPHFLIETDASAGRAGEIEALLELFLGRLETLFPFSPPPPPGAFRVRVFGVKEAFDRYYRKRFDHTHDSFAYFDSREPSLREIVAFEQEAPLFSRALFHETFHHYLHHYVESPPAWLDEGLAEWVEGYRSEGRGLCFVGNDDHLPLLSELLLDGAWIPVERLVRMGRAEWEARGAAAYAVSWALVAMLLDRDAAQSAGTVDACRRALVPLGSELQNLEEVAAILGPPEALDRDLRAWVPARAAARRAFPPPP
jgi:hypothetical protein